MNCWLTILSGSTTWRLISKPKINYCSVQQNLEIVQTRSSTETTAHRLDKTVVLSGLSSVEKPYADDATVRVSRYRFLRTYVASGTQCQLLAVQTMKLTTSDGAND